MPHCRGHQQRLQTLAVTYIKYIIVSTQIESYLIFTKLLSGKQRRFYCKKVFTSKKFESKTQTVRFKMCKVYNSPQYIIIIRCHIKRKSFWFGLKFSLSKIWKICFDIFLIYKVSPKISQTCHFNANFWPFMLHFPIQYAILNSKSQFFCLGKNKY